VSQPARVQLPKRKHARRSHAERTAETRTRIIAAVVDCIADDGFQGTTAQSIALRAGVTWGAAQHHFGGKDELLRAVLEDTFNRFAARMSDVPIESTPLEKRVSRFVELAWEHFRSRHFRCAFEILLNYLGRGEHADAGRWREEMTRAWDEVWTRIFSDVELPRGRNLMLQHFTISSLSGLAATLMMQRTPADLPRGELDVLVRTLLREFGTPSSRK
jgi:AcrR family transcriptional regulator